MSVGSLYSLSNSEMTFSGLSESEIYPSIETLQFLKTFLFDRMGKKDGKKQVIKMILLT